MTASLYTMCFQNPITIMFNNKSREVKHYPVRIFPTTMIFQFGETKIARELTAAQHKEVEAYYNQKGFKVKWMF